MKFKFSEPAFLLLAFLFLEFSSYAQEIPGESGPTLRILTYNILHGATTTGAYDLNQVAQVIRKIDPDITAIQEVDFRTRRSKNLDVATELAIKTQMVPVFAKATDYDGGAYGQAILSRWPLVKASTISLPGHPEKEPRIAVEAVIALPSGDTIQFIGTHLDHVKRDTDRKVQAEAINKLLAKTDHPVILAGDLNDHPGSRTIGLLESKWTSSYEARDPQPTFPSHSPQKKIEYSMVAPKGRWKVRKAKVFCNETASDHCAYLVELELLPAINR